MNNKLWINYIFCMIIIFKFYFINIFYQIKIQIQKNKKSKKWLKGIFLKNNYKYIYIYK